MAGVGHTCCRCIPIRVGVIIIAVLGIIGELIIFAHGIYVFATYKTDKMDLALAYAKSGYTREDAKQKAVYTVKFVLGIWICFFILGMIHIIACVVLLVGVTGRKPKLVQAYVTVGMGTLVLLTVWLLIAGIISLAYGVWVIAIFPASFFLVVAVPWAGYHIYVVRKYAATVEDENKPMAQRTQQISSEPSTQISENNERNTSPTKEEANEFQQSQNIK